MRDDAVPLAGEAGRFYDPFVPARKPPSEASGPGRVPVLLAGLGIDALAGERARRRAARNGTDMGWELVCAGCASEDALAAAIGRALDIPVEAIASTDSIVGRGDPGRADTAGGPMARSLRVCGPDLQGKFFMAPRLEELDSIAALLAIHPQRRSIFRVCTPRALFAHRATASLAQRSQSACLGLAGDRPALSARTVWTGMQGMVAGLISGGLAILLVKAPWQFLHVLHLGLLPLFLCCALARLLAARRLLSSHAADPSDGAGPALRCEGPRPVYSVLVALHDERAMVPGLVAALSALQWPRSRLEVMLVCEGDDAGTIAAVEAAIAGRPNFSLVRVPPSLPRTKPKALNVALPLASGEFLVIYDAEDRPRPNQLEAAYSRFAGSDERLACLQAPLVIRNGCNSWLSGHFALEYAALFRGFLPWLSADGLPLPLGGTSNHFRRAALEAVGAWDSHNVTEDADLGIRLYRAGYRVETIDVPTFEDAPESWRVWRNQRTRWMKGWIQTWLVHMRDPVALWRDLGAKGFVGFQLLFFGMLASSVAHAFLLFFLACTALALGTSGPPALVDSVLLATDAFTLIAGYLAFVVLATQALDREEKRFLPRHLWTLAVYWLLVSVAAFRAFLQLMDRPHVWEKTPHPPPPGLGADAGAESMPGPVPAAETTARSLS
jgi:cellulose synthase/poly-beta-1,6-N-acetylglucosamine synthase-like glycosyltransferase